MNKLKTLVVLSLLSSSIIVSARNYYVSPNGNDNAAGTLSAPWVSWQKAFEEAQQAGDTVYFRGGVYYYTQPYNITLYSPNGTLANPICYFNYPGEHPILDCSRKPRVEANFGIQFTGPVNYAHFKGLEIRNVKQQDVDVICAGIMYDYSRNVIFENISCHNNGGPGFESGSGVGNVTFLNCDSFDNYDLYNSSFLSDGTAYHGGGSAGFTMGSSDINASIIVSGCRAWHNSDGGFSFGDAGKITFINCWAWNNGYDEGDGNGFKGYRYGDRTYTTIRRTLINCIAVGNRVGYDQNNDPDTWEFYNCLAYHNGYERNCVSGKIYGGFHFYDLVSDHIFKNNVSFGNSPENTSDDFSPNSIQSNNSWNGGVTVNTSDYANLDTVQLRAGRKSDGGLPDITFAHLASGSDLIYAGVSISGVTLDCSGSPYHVPPSLGPFEFGTGSTPSIPVYVSSLVSNAVPTVLEMTYSLSLANIVPSTSAFMVRVNSVSRSVSSVSVSGTKVLLTLSSAVAYGDAVTVAYTKPATNPLQTAAGGQAASLGASAVTNNVNAPAVPVYVSSLVSNAAPAVVEMTYSLSLANILPATSAFTVRVNSVSRSVSSLSVSGTKVLLTLSSAVAYGDAVTVAYMKPATNPLQTAAGGQAASLGASTVTNNVNAPVPVYVSSLVSNAAPTVVEMTYSLSLANILPATSTFAVTVNSVSRSVTSVSVSGTKVLLTLSSAVAYGDAVTVAYTKPATNPLQTAAGGQAASLSAQAVTNNVSPAIPVYQSSAIENSTPTVVEMTYSLTLANIVPATSAFAVTVNSVSRSVTSVSVSGTKVLLTLSSAVAYGDVVTVAYTKPATNPLQTAAGGQAATLSASSVTNKLGTLSPVYVSSVVTNGTPSVIEMTYNMTLANIVPAGSAFTVTVNSVSRSVTSVTISGTKVYLTLSGSVAYGDIVTVAYNVPGTNPLQTAAGGQAATLSAQAVTNNVSPAIPVYQSSVVENSTPLVIEMTYDLSLANILPAASAFTVTVNSVGRSVTSVSVSGTKVLLTLSGAVIYGDVVKLSYTKPATNPLQTANGGQAGTISGMTVTNRVAVANTAPVIVLKYQSESYSGFVNEIDASGSNDPDRDNLTYTWDVPENLPVSGITGSVIRYLGPNVSTRSEVNVTVNVSDGKTTTSSIIKINIIPYKPELEVAEITNVEASNYQAPFYPSNIIDGDINTMWAIEGINQWLIIKLKHSFKIQYVKLVFQPGQRKESYFDILGSTDMVAWEPVLSKYSSCAFSGGMQIFDFPPSKAGKEYNYIKLVGLGNSIDSWNFISELKIFGYKYKNTLNYEKLPVKIFPNPAKKWVNVRIDEPSISFDFLRIASLSGVALHTEILDPGTMELQVPINLEKGIYLIQMGTNNVIRFAQKLVVVD